MQDIIDEHEPDELPMPTDLAVIEDGEFLHVTCNSTPGWTGGDVPCEVADFDGDVVYSGEVPTVEGELTPVTVMKYITENSDLDIEGYVGPDYLEEWWEETFPDADAYSWSG